VAKIKVLVLHGPNLNLLGEREAEVYGTMTLAQLNSKVKVHGKKDFDLRIKQSNHEGELIDLLHKNRKWADAVVINPGAYTHYSYALRDALAAIQVPAYEVHLSDISKREDFRKISVVKDVCVKQISGHGVNSYTMALDMIKKAKAKA
jgi:3-dehydroquinate dehydratase-2